MDNITLKGKNQITLTETDSMPIYPPQIRSGLLECVCVCVCVCLCVCVYIYIICTIYMHVYNIYIGINGFIFYISLRICQSGRHERSVNSVCRICDTTDQKVL